MESLLATRGEWLRCEPGSDPSAAVNSALLESLPTGWWQDAHFWEIFRERYAAETLRLIDRAEDVVSGSITLFQWKKIRLTRAYPVVYHARPSRKPRRGMA